MLFCENPKCFCHVEVDSDLERLIIPVNHFVASRSLVQDYTKVAVRRECYLRPLDNSKVFLCSVCSEAVRLTRNELSGKPSSWNQFAARNHTEMWDKGFSDSKDEVYLPPSPDANDGLDFVDYISGYEAYKTGQRESLSSNEA